MAQDMFGNIDPQGVTMPVSRPLWELGIGELAGRNLESAGRQDVNNMLENGWILLHIYTLRYRENDTWRERPMAILGHPT